MVTGLPQISGPSDICEDCVVGKQHRDSFPMGKAWRAKQPLQLIYSDLCGPINLASNSSKKYFISFTDDYNKKTWVYFLKEKNEACVDSSLHTTAKWCGGEKESYNYEHGAKHVDNQEHSEEFWPKAVNWSVHVLNRIFGCISYAHISDEKRKKLDDKGVKCVFLGVSEESKVYKLYNLVTKRIIISRDVIFDKEHAWDWNDTEKQPSLMNVDEEEVEKETA
ncbi:hypothetical protein Q3G72_017858 [Acer saccharum]|nr:hypothetical protein Q3G72_017858 [Acer saccharum]